MSLIPQVMAAPLGFDSAPTGMRITNINSLISSGISLALIIAGILAFVFLVWGGVEWLTSGGDKTKTEAARNRITAAMVGLAIIAASWAIMKLIGYFLGIDVFEGQINIPTPYTR